jgi:hypothetical protein
MLNRSGPFVVVHGRVGKSRAEQKCRLPEPRRAQSGSRQGSAQPLDESHEGLRSLRQLRRLDGLGIERDARLRRRRAARGLHAEARKCREDGRARPPRDGDDRAVPMEGEQVQEAGSKPSNPAANGETTNALSPSYLPCPLPAKHVRYCAKSHLDSRHLPWKRIAGERPLAGPAPLADNQRYLKHLELRPGVELSLNTTPREADMLPTARLAAAPPKQFLTPSGNRGLVVP